MPFLLPPAFVRSEAKTAFTLPACSSQAIQSRDRIQLQYSQSLIEKDQYRKQVRGLEAQRDELLTTLTSLEGAKALLEAQLQRAQGGSCLKVTGAREQGSWWVCWGPGRSSWPGLGTLRTLWETSARGRNMAGVLSLAGLAGLDGNLYWVWDHMGPIRTPELGLRKCRLWEGIHGSWPERSP